MRVGALIGISLVILYGLGRWDSMVSARYSELRQDTRVIMDLGKVARRRSDSLRLLEREALAQARTNRRLEDSLETSLGSLAETDLQEVADLRDVAVWDLLPPLQMQPIQGHETQIASIDSAGVRFLSRRMLRLDQLERRLPIVESLASSQGRSLTLFEAAASAAQTRADSAEDRVVDLEKLVVRWQAASTCKILLFLPCPSRGLSFVGGVAAAAVAVVVFK